MSTEDIVLLGGSAIVIIIMVGAAVLLGFRENARLDEADLARRIADAEPRAHVAHAAIAADGRAALARLADGRLVIAKAMGDRVSLRFYPPGAVKLTLGQGEVRAQFADLGFPPLTMALKEAPSWLADMAGARPTSAST